MGKPRITWRGRISTPSAPPAPAGPVPAALEQNLTKLLFALQDAELLAGSAAARCGFARPKEMAELDKLAGSLRYRWLRTKALLEHMHRASGGAS